MIEIKSDCSLAEAVQILTKHKILSAPVVDVEAPEDASWIDRYIGIVEFAGIAVWILYQVNMQTFSSWIKVCCNSIIQFVYPFSGLKPMISD